MKTAFHRRTIMITCILTMTVMICMSNTYTVTNTLDAGIGSLRAAITQINSGPLGPHTIVFNIPISDPGYNAVSGVYTITVTTLLPVIQRQGVAIDGTSQPINSNLFGPEICLRSTTNLTYGICFPLSGCKVKSMIITGFQVGILITNSGMISSGNCAVSDCYLGVNYNGTIAAPNSIGVACYNGAAGDTIKNNLISGNTYCGIAIRKSNSNIIKGNKIGTDRTGMSRLPNYYGLAIDSSVSNVVGGTVPGDLNLISGNGYCGVAVNTSMSHDNIIKGNMIGTNINALIRSDTINNYYGIAINDSYNNIIGGSNPADRNIISGNSTGGIAILGLPSKNNVIKGNYIGTNVNGNDSIPNGNGILLSGASGTAIGGSTAGDRNVISGNSQAGIAMAYSGTRNNTIKGNYIGVDATGTQILSNYAGVYLKSNANNNTVGGASVGERNIISGNYEMGLCVESSDSNVIIGNYIGPDVSGLAVLKLGNDSLVQGNGLLFNSNAKHNYAGGYNLGEGNVISGNRIYGHDIYGNSSYNYTINNYIGVDATGNVAMPNATGICVDGGSNHNPFINNVLSGNKAYGIFIVTTGTYYNELRGNLIGTNAAGTDTIPNQCGLLLGGGTKYNVIGGNSLPDRNVISGNRFDGILASDTGTSYNDIRGNYIGTNASGTAPIPNDIGIGFATNPSENNIENNVISGNKRIGLILYEHCNNNTVFSNRIGVASNGTTALNNGSAGIVIAKASQNNRIGEVGKGNIIAHNDTCGIEIMDTNTIKNTISSNLIFANGIMDIDLYPYGINANDPGDADLGANERMNYPVITNTFLDTFTGNTTINGTIDNSAPLGIIIELFKTDALNMFGHGGTTEYLGNVVVSDPGGTWTFTCNGLSPGDAITATATDTMGNTSELAANTGLIVGIAENSIRANNEYCVYPNPAGEQITVSFSLDGENERIISIYSLTGTKMAALENKILNKGFHVLHYDLSDYTLSPGMYFLVFSSGNQIIKSLKLILAK